MIVVKVQGGLGNQLFQYSIGRALSLKHGVKLYLDTSFFRIPLPSDVTPRKFELDDYNLSYEIADDTIYAKFFSDKLSLWDRLMIKIGKYDSFKILKEPRFEFDPNVSSISNNLYLDGYWQTALYFQSINTTLRKELKLNFAGNVKPELFKRVQNKNSISIHFRRGDYLSEKKNEEWHGVVPMAYYEQALDLMLNKVSDPFLFVFSDDIQWTKANFNPQLPVEYVNTLSATLDMELMSLCKHNILANSSFSWWGAWKNYNPEKIVVAPRKWFQTDKMNTRDLFPADWITI